MKFDPTIYPPEMRDGMNYADANVLRNLALTVTDEQPVFIEIGSWKGHSTCVLGQIAKYRNGKVYAVDHWKGSPGVPVHMATVSSEDVFNTFQENIAKFGLTDYVHPIKMDSETASKTFKDETADLIFIDADHHYSSIKKDIELWMPKLKKGGILCGHDCEGYYDNYSFENKQHIDREAEQDVSMANCHGGVVKALHDCFGKDFSLWAKPFLIVNEDKVTTMQYTSIWFKEK